MSNIFIPKNFSVYPSPNLPSKVNWGHPVFSTIFWGLGIVWWNFRWGIEGWSGRSAKTEGRRRSCRGGSSAGGEPLGRGFGFGQFFWWVRLNAVFRSFFFRCVLCFMLFFVSKPRFLFCVFFRGHPNNNNGRFFWSGCITRVEKKWHTDTHSLVVCWLFWGLLCVKQGCVFKCCSYRIMAILTTKELLISILYNVY